jgi:glutathione synthase/RimK-type ligase-like ATP-grasp enzyme
MRKSFPNLIIFSSIDDAHVQAVVPLIDSKTTVYVCDLGRFGRTVAASLDPENPESIALQQADGNIVSFQNVKAVWWRRPQPFAENPKLDKSVNEFVTEEKAQFWSGLLALLPENIRWYNHFQREIRASRKIYQLKAAKECGFRIPKTLVTSIPSEARNFIRANEKVICKELNGTPEHWRPTQLMTPDREMQLDSLSVCPVIFQEFVSGKEDYRVIVIDDFVQAVAFDMKHSRYPTDVSIDVLNRCWPAEIPDDLKKKLKTFLIHFGLRYGAFDLRLNDNGEFVFFELNSSGEFLYLYQRAETKIAAAFAQILSFHSPLPEIPNQREAIQFSESLPFLLQTPPRKTII